VLVIGAGSWVREWPAEKFAGLINKLYEVRTIGILLGSPAERSKRDEILQYLSVPVIDLVGKTSFSNMPAVIATADFMVTLDTSVMHLASLLDKRIFALFSSGNIELSKPIFNRDVSIIKKELGCSGCGDNCFLNRPRCIERIGVNDVWSALCTTAANGIA
jgi:heptosyltransferase-2